MTLLLVIDHFGSGGAQRQLVNLAVGLRARGHAVSVFVYYPEHGFFAGQLEAAGVAVLRARKRGRFSLQPIVELRRQLMADSFDSALAFLDTPSLYLELASIGASGTRIFVSERASLRAYSSTLTKRLRCHLHRLAFAVVFNSFSAADEFGRIYPWVRRKTHVIYNGVDLVRFAPNVTSTYDGSQLRLLAIGSVIPDKNAEQLMHALAICRDKLGFLPAVSWIGKVLDDDLSQQCKAKLDRLRVSLRLENAWSWESETLDIAARIGSCDALIHPSLHEGLSNVVCEALCAGKPVLVNRNGDNPLLVEDGKRGFLFDAESPMDMANQILRLARLGPEARSLMGREARGFAENNLGLDLFVSRYEALLSGAPVTVARRA